MKIIISDSIAVNFFGFDWFVVFFCCVCRLVGKSRDGKGEEEEDRDEEEGKKGEAQLSYPSQDPPPGYCRGSPQSPPAKILAPGGPLGARIHH